MEVAGKCPCGHIFGPELCYGYTYFPYHRECVKAGMWPLVKLYRCEANISSNAAYFERSGSKNLDDVPEFHGIDLCSLVNMEYWNWTSLIGAKCGASEPKTRRRGWHRVQALYRFTGDLSGHSLLEASYEPPSGSAASCGSRSQDMAQAGHFTKLPCTIMKEYLMRLRLPAPATDAVIDSPSPRKLPEATTIRSDIQDSKLDPWKGKGWFKRQDTIVELNALQRLKSGPRKLPEAETPFSYSFSPDIKSDYASRYVTATVVAVEDPRLHKVRQTKAPVIQDPKLDSWKGEDWYESWKHWYNIQESAAEMSALESCKATAISSYEFVFAPERHVSSAPEAASVTVDAAHSRASGASRGSSQMGRRSRSECLQRSLKQSPVGDGSYNGSTRFS